MNDVIAPGSLHARGAARERETRQQHDRKTDQTQQNRLRESRHQDGQSHHEPIRQYGVLPIATECSWSHVDSVGKSTLVAPK
jgi:hypothetical protein